ncbi:NAD(+)--dinitrogen-reductase ADP-D-ribosyltransferase [Paludibacterium yongneupense]|uniref:NAD(+)--dinitrogen-reductase ADP-D-ribosyltransferase n=1 Tax=Paludibacterium yongneupense TaxID=400061 RepID=UPI00040C78FB|nr:NAD(+)--dinitrogen-reductase ADP-D-ribosyltransferase [Paludibacterium yongneupense]
MDAIDTVAVGHSTNLVGIPTGLLGSIAFNEHPLPLHISGARDTSPALWSMLDDSTCIEGCLEAFRLYMEAAFDIGPTPNGQGVHRYRSHYRLLLQGWGFDSNSPQGAVLKGWVESRFGLIPTFHKQTLGRYPSAAWMGYLQEKMSGRYHNNAIHLQLDMLYEFCQWMLARRIAPGESHMTLYRGVNDFEEHHIVSRISKREAVVRQNNLVSFSARREVAEQFGDVILEVRVPLVKVVFFAGLLSGSVLSSEGEYLVLGGDYQVRMSYY